jgi:hypothetical protein
VIDLDAFDRLGEYASDCRWSAVGGEVRGLDGAAYPEIATAIRDADGEWIAALDPPTVRAMVAELRAAREVIEAVLADTNDVSMRTDIALDVYERLTSQP